MISELMTLVNRKDLVVLPIKDQSTLLYVDAFMHCLVADFCYEHQCQNNGTCVNGAVGYTCLCESVWIGNLCDIGKWFKINNKIQSSRVRKINVPLAHVRLRDI